MPLRNSLKVIADLSDLTYLGEIVVDKRSGQRASGKRNRRNRHYEKQFIRNSLSHGLVVDQDELVDDSERPCHLQQGLQASE